MYLRAPKNLTVSQCLPAFATIGPMHPHIGKEVKSGRSFSCIGKNSRFARLSFMDGVPCRI
jgi:hypothetical protein